MTLDHSLDNDIKTFAFILAAGSGRRLGAEMPKQFMEIAGKPVLAHTLDIFEKATSIDEITVVYNPDYYELTSKIIADGGYSKVCNSVAGGAERHHSTLAALETCRETNAKIIIHDAVRMLVTVDIIDAVVRALDRYRAVTTAIPVTDTIIESSSNHRIVSKIPDRSQLFGAQTPQGFHLETLQEAYDKALLDPLFKCTDDCGVISRYLPSLPIGIVEGSSRNIKLTYPSDIAFIESALHL